MKKSKIKLLTATACLALVGTASAAWVYAGSATESANIGVKVASYASAGEITVAGADNYYLFLDYGSVTFKQKEEGTDLVATHDIGNLTDTGTTYTYTVKLNGILGVSVKFSDSTINNDYVLGSESDYSDFYRISKAITWTSGQAITLPSLEWDTASNALHSDETWGDTIICEHDTSSSETRYKSLIQRLNGTGVDSDWNQNEDVDVGDLITITFTATVNS